VRSEILQRESGAGIHNDLVRCGFSTWQPGQRCPVHSHERAIEFFVFLDGEIEVEVTGRTHNLRGGETIYIGPGERHRLTVTGDRPVSMFWLVAPNHIPSHTYYRSDGTPVYWDFPGTPPDTQEEVDSL
jgi:quercetin dioxygenase-like cupin family protein